MIRCGTVEDIGFILPLMRQALIEVRYHEEFSEGQFCLRWAQYMESGRGLIILAERDNKLVGILLGAVADSMFAHSKFAVDLLWYVLPEYRRQGIGESLRFQFELEAKELGCSHVTMGIWEKFEPEKTAARLASAGYIPLERYAMKELAKVCHL